MGRLWLVGADLMHVFGAEDGAYSELKVMESGAGWYVGRSYDYFVPGSNPKEISWSEPGSRESGYFATELEAEDELELMRSAPRMAQEVVESLNTPKMDATADEILVWMIQSADPDDWERRCRVVKKKNGGEYPHNWGAAVVLTDLYGRLDAMGWE